MVAIGSKSRMGSLEGIRNKAGVEEYGPKKVSTMDAHKLGQKSVSGLSGLKQWGSNTWNGMSKNQQLGAKIGAGALAAGTIYLGMKKLKKKKQENE